MKKLSEYRTSPQGMAENVVKIQVCHLTWIDLFIKFDSFSFKLIFRFHVYSGDHQKGSGLVSE